MKVWFRKHKKAIWITVLTAAAAVITLAAARHYSRILSEQKRAELLKASFEKDVLTEYTDALRKAGLEDIAAAPSYYSGDSSSPLWNQGSFDSLYVTYTYSSEKIDQYYSKEYGDSNALSISGVLNEIKKIYYEYDNTYITTINGRECRMYTDFGTLSSFEVDSASHRYVLWCFDRSSSVDIDGTTVYYDSAKSAGSGSSSDGHAKSSAGTGSSGSSTGSYSGSTDEDKSLCDDYYDDWDDEDEAEENLYDYYGEEGSDDYWDEEE